MSWSINLTIIFACIFVFLILQVGFQHPTTKRAMKSFLNKARAALDDAKQQHLPAQFDGPSDRASSIQPPTPADVIKYRYHHGTNLGSVFVLERWLTGCMFRDDFNGSSELVAAEGWVKFEGIEKARERFEKHWQNYCSDANLDWLKSHSGCTTIRLPIGYWTLGPAYCDHTPFKSVGAIYEHAWAMVKDVVKRCHERGMGVVLDLHGVPGGANGGDHSGTNSGKAEFWNSRKNRNLATRCLCFIAQQAKSMEGVAGIQVVNESEYNAPHMYEWYDEVHKELSSIDPSMPIYISDGWDLSRCAEWVLQKNTVRAKNASPIVIDTHLYWAYTDEDHKKSPQQITGEVWSKLSEQALKDGSVCDRGASQAIVGEYSTALDGTSWSHAGNEKSREDLTREFGNAESWRFQQRAGGSFFWTYLMDWMPGGDWGFKHLTEQNAIIRPKSLTVATSDCQQTCQRAHAERDHRRGTTWGVHCQYWDTNHPGHYEHERFPQGWDVGFSDAMAFFEMRSKQNHQGTDKIGMLDLWILKRLRDSGQSGKFVWEYEQGMRQGIRDFYEVAGI